MKADAAELFWAFFTNAYPSREMMEAATKDPDSGIEVVESMIEKLCEEFDPPYAPDGEGDDEETLVAAIHIHAMRLVRTYRLHDWLLSEDVRSLVQKLTSLRVRLRNLQGNPNFMDESVDLVGPDLALARVDMEIAAQDGEYMRALRLMADNLPKELFAEVRLGDNAPDKKQWTFEGVAQRVVNWINALKGRHTDWDAVLDMLDKIALRSLHGGETVTDEEGYSWLLMDYDRILREWIRGSLSLPEIRSIYEKREDLEAERRLQVYYFADGLWDALPKRARAALVSADRAFVTGDAGRAAAILNELRVATVELLHQRLWEPLIAWADKPENHAVSRAIRYERDRLQGRFPDLDAFEKALGNVETERFLIEQVGLDKDALRFIKQKAAKRLGRLRRARNAAEHTPGHEADHAALHALYAEAVGIGQKGVLPELARLLAAKPPP